MAAAAAVVGLVVGGCGSQVAGAPAAPAVADASGVDMCTILTDAELTGLGIRLETREPVDELGLIGCSWLGTRFTLSLERDEETVGEYLARREGPQFVNFRENTVNGRAGVQFSVTRALPQCVQMLDGGPISLRVAVAEAGLGPPIDACAEVLRVVEMVEPRLPKAGT
ncbi:MAG: DUF3558 domain-containing protein [Actinobacteria bacterium]|nr:DUF3558 domain-containing protein [Actinomycetota bacterium]